MDRRKFLKILSESAAGLAFTPKLAHALCPPQNIDVLGGHLVTSSVPCSVDSVATVLGEYWGLPKEYPAKSSYGGLYQIWGKVPRPVSSSVVDICFVGGQWSVLEPKQGEINWAKLETQTSDSKYSLEEIRQAGKKAIIWVAMSENKNGVTDWNSPDFACDVPKWVFQKCADEGHPLQIVVDPRGGSQPPLWGPALWQNDNTVPKNPSNPRKYLLDFIRRIGERYNNPANPYYGTVALAYVTTFNAGGEFSIPSEAGPDGLTVRDKTRAAGLTEEAGGVLETYAKDIINAWVSALGRRRCVWEGTGEGWCPGAINVNKYAINTLGLNFREGIGEVWNSSSELARFRPTTYKQNIDPTPFAKGAETYYLTATTMDQLGYNAATKTTGINFYGDELEVANRLGVPTTATATGDYRHYRLAILNALRKGVSHIILPSEVICDSYYPWSSLTRFRVLRDYFRQTAGAPASKAADAWVILQQWNDGSYNGLRKFDNFEKFIVQRDVSPGGVTSLAETSSPYTTGQLNWTSPMSISEARCTHHASGNDYIYFKVDDKFALASERVFQICVYYKDVGAATWRMEYSTPTTVYANSDSVKNQNSGVWKTAIFTLQDVQFRKAQAGDMDFRLYNGGLRDITVGLVRVVRSRPVPD